MSKSARDIAIVGYSCRLPSASDPAAFWSVLENGECVVSEIQPGRWARNRFGHADRHAAGKSYTWRAGQIDDPFGFDPTFFGISPREALQIDPQQRLLLQVAFEALEHAGIPAAKLAGSETGVYVGASSVDYSNAFVVDPAASDIQLMTGNTLSIVSNRLSYVFDLKGPSFTVDTACSSSIVALHEALEAMRAGRIDTAIVGGVNMLLSPFAFIGFSRASMLSPTGLCRAFDADGDGYVRSEGAVVFVLKTVEAALAAGDPIRGVLVGSGINSDGRTAGLSLPSSEQQAALLRHVYERFEIDPDALAYVEAHGTGTRVGDPAEANALGEVLGVRRDRRLPIGSVKTNIGHLEAASGMAGLLKAQLALEKRMLPPSLHFHTPNPDIAFDDLNIEVVTAPRPLDDTGTPLYAGVNSFGFGGANAHAVLRQPAPHETARRSAPPRIVPLIVSAQSPEALRSLAGTWHDRLDGLDAAETARLTNSAAYARDRLDHRLVALGGSAEEIQQSLEHYLQGARANDAVSGRAAARSAPVAFVFSGNGSQWPGMGRAAYQGDAAFRTAFDMVTRLFIRVGGWSLLTTLFSPDIETDLERTEIAQPLLFAVQVATVEALAARGLKPDMVAGHSVGEVAAAWAAGALTLEAAVFLIHVRSTQQEVTRHLGGMAALLVSAADANAVLGELGFRTIELAADNSPRSVTLSGTHEELAEFAKAAKKRRLALRKLKLDYPFHCALIEPIRQPLTAALATLQPRETTVPYVSAVTGELVEGAALGAEYWWRNVRQPVHFRAATETLAEMGAKVFVEIGPKPVLQTYVADTLAGINRTGGYVPSLDSNDDDVDGNLFSLIAARALVNGAPLDDVRFFGQPSSERVTLPRYPWQNQPYRVEPTREAVDVFGSHDDHPLLGYRLRHGVGPWTGHIDATVVPWLADHKVESSTVFPAAGFVEMALSAVKETLGDGPIELRDLDILRPMVLEDGEPVETRTDVSPDGQIVEIESRRRLATDEWSLHIRARFARPPVAEAERIELPELRSGGLGHDALYELTRRFGLDYGPAFRRAVRIAPIDDASLWVELSGAEAETLGDATQVLHPTLLDASFHGLFWLITRMVGEAADSAFLPVRIGDLRVYAAGRTPAGAIVTVTRASPRSVEATFTLIEADGSVVARASGVRFRAVLLNRAADPDSNIYGTIAVRLPERGEAVDLPSSWADPALSLARLAITSEGTADPDDAQVLMDAGCRAIALETLATFADEAGTVMPDALVGTGSLAHGALPLLNRLADALEEDGAVERMEEGWRLSEESPYPSSETVIATLVASHPRRIAESMALVRTQAKLGKRLAEGLVDGIDGVLPSALADHLETSAPVSAPLHLAAERAALDLAAAWPADRRLAILLVGGDSAALARRLAAVPAVTDVAVTDPDQGRLDRIALDLKPGNGISVIPFSGLGEGPAFDVAVTVSLLGRAEGSRVASAVRQAMGSGGLFLTIEPEATFFADTVFGQSAAWWSGSLDAAFPIGARRDAAGYTDLLADAGFRGVTAAALRSDTARAVVLTGRAPKTEDIEVAGEAGPVLVLMDGDRKTRSLADALAAALAGRGRPVRVANAVAGAEGRTRIEAIDAGSDAELMTLLGHGEVKDLVYLPGVAGPTEDPLAETQKRVMTIHSVLGEAMKPPARLWLVAPGGSGVVPVDGAGRAVETALWGLGRVLMNEYPDIGTRLVDLASGFEPSEAAERVADAIEHPGDEHELIVDVRGRAAVRVATGPALVDIAAAANLDGPVGRSLAIERQGTLDGLAWRTVGRPAPVGDEVEIEVAAAGLNFRDVMWALGLLPEEALEDGFAGATLGMECSGVVTRVGPGATRFTVGSRVIAFAPACFATHVTVAEKALAPVPSTVDLEAAATIPVTFLTAYYALVELARLDEGETILIHGGAGGVGLAALQIALARGAKVIATAGSEEKRRLLSMLGAAHVLDSRSLAFADEVMTLTGGAGVDVVLNSLFGEAMERSLETLKPFGRFVELGKRDYYANTQIGLRPFRQNLSYFGVDADQLLNHRPKLTERVFRELVDGFESGAYTALPYRVYPAERITAAFRLMQQSGHTGKILIRPPAAPAAPATAPVRIRGDATYLVAGGLGGFGAETARFLVERGARHLVLTSRTGRPSPAASAIITELEGMGASIAIRAADVTDPAAIAALFAEIDASMPPLQGVLHTAMVIDDALFRNLDAKRIEAVMAPKITGASVLDAATRGRDLDLFVMYSSATTLIGNPGQSAYVAANAYLEGLARARRAAGLPALAVAWGAIADAGYLARNTQVGDMLSMRLGKQSLNARAALAGLGMMLDAGAPAPVMAYAKIDWSSARKELPIMATPLASRIGGAEGDASTEGIGDGHLAALIEGLDHAKAVKVVTDLLAGEISRILRLPLDDIDAARPLTEIGMDSLMALELRMAAERRLGVDIPLLSLANGAALGDIARRIVEKAGTAETTSGEVELAAARHIDADLDEDLSSAIEAVEGQAEKVKRLI